MSVNKKMHPRNVFKIPPCFSELGQKYPEFNKHLKIGLDGKLSFNFNDVDALRALSKVLLLHYFDITIEIPKETLVPTVPLRLNYILWLQDLVDFLKISNNDVSLIDIGAGATCIYGLLATKLRKWKVLALELNNESFVMAKQNVEANLMTDYITVKKTDNGDNLLRGSLEATNSYTLSMCNPPFFEENDASNEQSKPKVRPPNNAFTGTANELACPGGEVAFVEKLIDESKVLKDKIMVYTTMIGRKKSLKILRKKLSTSDVCSFIQTEFYQGNTTRWALAWTYKNINLQEFHSSTTKMYNKSSCPKTQSISHVFENNHSIQDFLIPFEIILKEMKMNYEVLYANENLAELKVQAIENTWKNARRKRREQNRKDNIVKNIESTLNLVNLYVETNYEDDIKNIIDTLSNNNQDSEKLNDSTLNLKNILNKIMEIQSNINKNLMDINENLSKIDTKDDFIIDQILHCENLFIGKKTKLKLFLDTMFKNISTVMKNDGLDVTASFLQLLPNARTSNNVNKRGIDDENVGKKLKTDCVSNCKQIDSKHILSDKSNSCVVDFTVLLKKMIDQGSLQITFFKTGDADNSNSLCEIYNYVINKLKK